MRRKPPVSKLLSTLNGALLRAKDFPAWKSYYLAADHKQAFLDRVTLATEVLRLRKLIDDQAAEMVTLRARQQRRQNLGQIQMALVKRGPGLTEVYCYECGAKPGEPCKEACKATWMESVES